MDRNCRIALYPDAARVAEHQPGLLLERMKRNLLCVADGVQSLYKVGPTKVMKPIKNVTEYIARAPKETQSKLRQLRVAIKQAAPGTEERIGYGMPYYYYKGRLAYFSVWKKHIGLYVPTPVIEEHERQLRNYETAKATVQFPLDEKLPLALIKKLIKARVKKNDARGGSTRKS